MPLQPIRRNGYADPDRSNVEEAVAKAVEANPEHFIDLYKQDARSLGGRYVAADLFKETFEQFAASRDARNRYNAPVHNSAAVLAAELFRQLLADRTQQERDTVIFLTGIPGAGKTSSVLAGGEMPQHYRMIFEGQLSNPSTTKEKIRQVIDAGLKPVIIVVHARPENALENTFRRFNEQGRGASINVMSSIQGGLPDSLHEVEQRFGDAVELKVFDYRDRSNPTVLSGWSHLPLLESEGNHVQIKQRLSDALEQHRIAGIISEACYRQASGAAPIGRDQGLGRADHEEHETHVGGRNLPPGSREKAVLRPFHEFVAERLIEHLKAGTAPWQRRWQPGAPGTLIPINPTTGKRYRGINAIHLMSQGHDADQRWMTYKQAAAAGAQVRKGERGTVIQYWKFSEERSRTDANGKPVLDNRGEPVKVSVELERPKLFFATVFNATQIDGLPVQEPRTMQSWSAVERAEQILSASNALICHSERNSAYYRVSTDTIHLPEKGQFPSADRYYATALHELGHWTGHVSRLDRDLAHPFGSEGYAKEELRAEIASMILGDELGSGHDPEQHAAYVGSWINALQNDPLEIFRAAADAEKIQDYVLGLDQKQALELGEQGEEIMQQPGAEDDKPDEILAAKEITDSDTDPARQTATEKEENEPGKMLISVPFRQKEAAKARGAKWDRQEQSWYVPAGIDPAPFAAWSQGAPAVAAGASQPSAPIRNVLQNAVRQRQYLAVPYGERVAAKAAGAAWDKAAKSWYAGPNADMARLER